MSVENSPYLQGLSYPRSTLKILSQYTVAFLLSILFTLLIFHISTPRPLLYPFNYYGDTIFYAMTIKSVITTGWYLSNPFIGAPGIHFLGDFPTPEVLNYLIIKFIALFTSNWVLVINLFFLLGFPLITLTSLFVCRQLGLAYLLALTASLLYTFLPYHLIKEQYHLFLSGYYLVPLAIWLALLLYQNRLFENKDKKKRLIFLYAFISILIGSNGVYYAYFSSFFLLLGGVIGSIRDKEWKPLKQSSFFIGLIVVAMALNIFSTITYDFKNGVNRKVIKREFIETEECALKIAQLLLPRDHDRLFSKLKESYNSQALSVTENTASSLGLVGALGFLALIGTLFFSQKDSLLKPLAHFNLGALFLGTMGGFSSLLSFFFLPQIRAYHRISVFIAFFSLLAFFLLLQKYVKNQTLLKGLTFLILAFGIFNQSSSIDPFSQKYPQRKKDFRIDRAFITAIENSLPPGSMIFQLPYIYFPEGPRDQINSYAHFKGPLHSKTLRWSFGAMHNREVDEWQKRTSQLPLSEMIEELRRVGFSGLYVDKFGYENEAKELTAQLQTLLKTPPIYDRHGRSFWDIREE